jgi:hypothetical protein
MSENESSRWNSLDTEILVFDGPGDNTVRPCPPELLAFMRAEREKLIRYGAFTSEPPDPENIIVDVPGDNTIRPCPPEWLPRLRAEREKLIRYGALPPDPPTGADNGAAGNPPDAGPSK